MSETTLFETLDYKSRIELVTRLDNSSRVKLDVICAGILIEANHSPRLFNLLAPHELIAYRTVKEFNDVYSFKSKTISIHPSTFYYLKERNVEKILTYARDKKTLTFAKLEAFDSILDLGIGPLRRADIARCEEFQNANPIDVRDLKKEAEIVTPLVYDELLKQTQTRAAAEPRLERRLFS